MARSVCRTPLYELPPFPARDWEAGERIADRYLLIELLGQGGMGSVWRARCLRLGGEVAIKLLRVRAVQPGSAERLRLEAQAAARVQHPATVRVLDFGTTAAGEPFLVLELLAGRPLSALLKEHGSLSEPEAIRLLLPVAERALHGA